jgi:molybdopterin-guanine dinucleotide biosynthesis protein A
LNNSLDHNFSAAILAGGKNSRFNGKQKSFLSIGNQSIIERNIEVLKNIFDEIIIVSNNIELYHSFSNCKIVNDYYKEIGPLGGIHAALESANHNNVFIVSCDMPFLNATLIELQLLSHKNKNAAITIALQNGLKEPLHSIYNKNILKKLEYHINTTDSFKIRNIFNLFKVNYFEVPAKEEFLKAFTNINHPEDYFNIQKLFKQ